MLSRQLSTMLKMQAKANSLINPAWMTLNHPNYRAIWIECGELMDHYGFKWWKHQKPDMEQVKLEVVDIWHFGMSMMLNEYADNAALKMVEIAEDYVHDASDVLTATERLALYVLSNRRFSFNLFLNLLSEVEMSLDDLYSLYVSKNVLVCFRQNHGYNDGTYSKLWHGKEDNEHLMEIIPTVKLDDDFQEALYKALEERYKSL